MKVYIGKYPNQITSNIYNRYIEWRYKVKFSWQHEGEQDKWDILVEKIESLIQGVYNLTINQILDKLEQKIKVRIDKQDTWAMDTTLSHIILPMLKQLKETKHGSPHVDAEDVPENLRESDVHAHWDWVMGEMIWAFEQVKNDNGFRRSKHNELDKQQKWQARKANGLRLFGKYYEGLWD